jgi:uncharacterized Rossmann fold enzyme
MPIRDNRRLHKVQPNVVRTIKKQVIQHNVQPVSRDSINKQNILYGKIDPIWDNETVYIVGGGPSLSDFDWNKLKGKKVIAINRAFQVLPEADVVYWTDSRFWKWYSNEIKRFRGLKVTCRPYSPPSQDVILLKAVNNKPYESDPSHISHGNNSGYGAINLAVKLGAKKIYLLGYDMDSSNNKTHWHNGYEAKHNHGIYIKMIQSFTLLAPVLKQMGVVVLNANPKSNLKVFNMCSLESALRDEN